MADWIADVVDAMEIDQCAIVGHSMGSLVSLEAAARHPQRFSRLVLIAIAAPMAVSDPLLDAWPLEKTSQRSTQHSLSQ